MGNQLEMNKNRVKLRDEFVRLLPGVGEAVKGVMTEAYKDGALNRKTKRLISLAVALGAGCCNCILAQTTNALDTGATKEEILETISVVVSMRGTTGVAESLRVIQLLDELGKL